MKKTLVPLLAGLALFVVPGCVVPAVLMSPTGAAGFGTSSGSTGAIVVNGLSANPSNTASRNDKITFTIDAFDNNGLPMQYSWSSTKGTLSATAGQTVYWSPLNSSGQLDQGLATVQVLMSDSSGATKPAAVNIEINPDGTAQTTTATPLPPAPSPTPAPTASPAATSSAAI